MLERQGIRRIARTNSRRAFTARRSVEHIAAILASGSGGNDGLGRSQSRAGLAAVVELDATPLERILNFVEGLFSGNGSSALEELDRIFIHAGGSSQLGLGDFKEAAGRFDVLWE